jgi:hypothetical protein
VAALYHAKDVPVPEASKVAVNPALTVADEGVTAGDGVGVLVKATAMREPVQPSDDVCSA